MRRKRPQIPDLARTLKRAHRVLARTAREQTEQFANEQRDAFVERIEEQDFRSFRIIFYPESGTNLSPRWLARKAAKGADERTMIATGHYTRSIRVFPKKLVNGMQFRVGFHSAAVAHDLDGRPQNVTLNFVAKVLEHGSEMMHIPARPHWGPHLNRMRREAGEVRERIVRIALQRLKRRVV